MRNIIFFILTIISFQLSAKQEPVIMTNPLNLSYRFQNDGISRREAADPVIILFQDTYFLFCSHASGYWYSSNLKDWRYIATKTLKAVEAWAPAVFVYKDAIYYLGMGEKRIFKSTNPLADEWDEIPTDLNGFGDPSFFQDNDGRVYLYYGCSDNAPIRGFEVDPKNNFKPITPEYDLIPHNAQRFGWEVFGENNEQYDRKGWNEGPCITKHENLYYLMYATPGTEFTCYCSAAYVSNNPLGPYIPTKNGPFAIKPGGFVRGGGHGHPFKDRYGNNWYVATLIVSAKEHFERRIGIFPAYYHKEYAHAITDGMDFPFILPDKKVDFSKENLSTGMNLLSFGKKITASSSLPPHDAQRASDENIKTWWAAATGRIGEWLQTDLGSVMKVSAIQVCFADEGSQTYRKDLNIPIYRYTAEYSTDGKNWKLLADRSKSNQDQIYELIVLQNSVKARFVRIKNTTDLAAGNFSITDLRLFGTAEGKKPAIVSGFTAKRNENRRRIAFSWEKQQTAEGYILRWGTSPEQMNQAITVYETSYEAGFFDSDASYYFTIEAFNESGTGKTCIPLKIN